MTRLKLTLLYFFTIALLVVIAIALTEDKKEIMKQRQFLPELRAAANGYQYMTYYRLTTLSDYAKEVAKSEVVGYISTLRQFRGKLLKLAGKVRGKFEKLTNVTAEQVIKFVREDSGDVLKDFEKTLEQRADKGLPKKNRKQYLEQLGDIFASCAGEPEPWDVCFFKFSYLVLYSVVWPQQKAEWTGRFPELFILVDPDGTTGRILFDKFDRVVENLPQYSLEKEAQKYRSHRRIMLDKSLPALDELKRSFQPTISSYLRLDSRIFVVVAARIEDPFAKESKHKFLGAVVVGYELDEGRAKRDGNTILGAPDQLRMCEEMLAQEKKGARPLYSEAACEMLAKQRDRAISFLLKERYGAIDKYFISTLPEPEQRELIRTIQKADHPLYETENLVAIRVPFELDYIPEGEALYAYLSIDLTKSLAPLTSLEWLFVVVGILAFVVGVIILNLVVRTLIKQFEQIDSGIHEVIAGNFDYQFPFDFPDQLPRSMAQSLTIMKHVLLGQPLPEEMEIAKAWTTDLRFGEEEFEELEQTDEKSSEQETVEPSGDYYRNLYEQFIKARKQVGLDTSGIDFVSFMHKVTKTEDALKKRHGVKKVRFRVEVKSGDVVLVPVLTSEEENGNQQQENTPVQSSQGKEETEQKSDDQ